MIDLEVTITGGGSMVHLWPPRWWGQDLLKWSLVHPYLLQESPSSLTLNQRAVGEEHVAEHLAQFTGEGEQGHVSPNTGAP